MMAMLVSEHSYSGMFKYFPTISSANEQMSRIVYILEDWIEADCWWIMEVSSRAMKKMLSWRLFSLKIRSRYLIYI